MEELEKINLKKGRHWDAKKVTIKVTSESDHDSHSPERREERENEENRTKYQRKQTSHLTTP